MSTLRTQLEALLPPPLLSVDERGARSEQVVSVHESSTQERPMFAVGLGRAATGATATAVLSVDEVRDLQYTLTLLLRNIDGTNWAEQPLQVRVASYAHAQALADLAATDTSPESRAAAFMVLLSAVPPALATTACSLVVDSLPDTDPEEKGDATPLLDALGTLAESVRAKVASMDAADGEAPPSKLAAFAGRLRGAWDSLFG